MNTLKISLVALLALVGTIALIPQHSAIAAPVTDIRDGVNSVGGTDSGNDITLGARIKTIVNILLFVLGAVAVVMIVIGGVRYTTSNGEASQVKGAKDTILYSVIGLIVAIMSYAIVNFILDQF
jgi:hypothetical protein